MNSHGCPDRGLFADQAGRKCFWHSQKCKQVEVNKCSHLMWETPMLSKKSVYFFGGNGWNYGNLEKILRDKLKEWFWSTGWSSQWPSCWKWENFEEFVSRFPPLFFWDLFASPIDGTITSLSAAEWEIITPGVCRNPSLPTVLYPQFRGPMYIVWCHSFKINLVSIHHIG